jgi:manganese oxidase
MRFGTGDPRLDVTASRRAVLTGLGLAYGVGFWTHLLHARAGTHAAAGGSFVTHWLRDSTLSVPLVVLAVVVATFLAQRAGASRRLTTLTQGVGAAVAMAVGVPFHGQLFGHATPVIDTHAAHLTTSTPNVALSMGLELLIDLPVALLLAAVAGFVALHHRELFPARRRALGAGAALLTLVGTGLAILPAQGSAQAAPEVCAPGSPIRSFDVQAIDVDIPLNRFGDHDPAGKMYALSNRIADIRAQEASREVTLGLREDPIQPLVIRANEGDCVEITFTNNASIGSVGLHIDGLAYSLAGDKVGTNVSGEAGLGGSKTYRIYVPNDPAVEGAHYISPGAGHRAAIDHGLFGILSVEPPGSQFLSPATLAPIESGWEAVIVPSGAPSFRENVKIMHEIGNESEKVYDAQNNALPTVDPITEAYRPGSRGMNYRSEPFMNRLEFDHHEKAHSYSSSKFGDPATIIPQGYLGDPTKFRVVHGGAEVFHIYHLHGGGDRWRSDPEADTTNSYADTGLHKQPVETSDSDRLDAVNTGPGEHFNAEIEGGAGGAQQAAGDFLFHCHIAEHYPSGMWGLWRVFDTLQPGLMPLPDRIAPPAPVTSNELIGLVMPNGTQITPENLDAWIRPQLPAQGVPIGEEDASVWDWTVDTTDPANPVYLGEPEPLYAETPNFVEGVPGHFGSLAGDEFLGTRPVILFNPLTGRPAYPLLRPHLVRRPPFSPNEHSGAPWLGNNADTPGDPATANPWLSRPDGLCPANAPLRNFNVVAVNTPIPVTTTKSDAAGLLFTLAQDKAALLGGTKKKEPLAIRMNVGDCAAVTLTSEQQDPLAFGGYAKVEMHIHHVQFDPQGSDGTSAGYNYEHSIRPYTIEDTKLSAAAAIGATSVIVDRVDPKYRVGVAFGVGLGTNSIEIATIVSVDPATRTIVLDTPLQKVHGRGQGAGIEFAQYRWYADALLDNIFWHDHVDGIHGWGHGGVGMLVVEPRGSTYHDPVTGAKVTSGTIVDIHTNRPLAPGIVNGSFREMVVWTIDDNPVTDSSINFRASPWSDRVGDPSLTFSSYRWGDPITPLLRAYPGDPVVIRSIHVGPTIDSFRVDGHHFYVNKRNIDHSSGGMYSRVTDTIHSGVSERYTLILDGGAGGVTRQPGDYLYHNGIARRFRQGAWGIMRVLPGQVADLQPLPGYPAPATPYTLPVPNGARPPATTNIGNPCPAGAPQKTFAVSAVDLPSLNIGGPSGGRSIRSAFVVSPAAASAKKNGVSEPLIMHVATGDCVTVTLKNEKKAGRVSFSVGELAKAAASSGVNVGFTPEQTVAVGLSRQYRFFADNASIEGALVSDTGGDMLGKEGLYAAIVVAEPGATFTHPTLGSPTSTGAIVDVHVPGQPGYRDVTLLLQDDDAVIGSDFMPYPKDVSRTTSINYKNAGLRTDDFSGTPTTPLIRAYVGDPMKIHVLSTPGSEQPHVFRAGGFSWDRDPYLPHSQEVAAQGLAPYQGIDVHLIGGAGGRGGQTGDFFYGDNRRPFSEAGMWGIIRVLPRPSCAATTPIRLLDGAACG